MSTTQNSTAPKFCTDTLTLVPYFKSSGMFKNNLFNCIDLWLSHLAIDLIPYWQVIYLVLQNDVPVSQLCLSLLTYSVFPLVMETKSLAGNG